MTAPQPSSPSGSYEAGGGSFGRDLRLVTGAVLIVGNLFLIYLDIKAKEPVTTQDVILHSGLLVAAMLLMDPKRTIELIGSIKDKLPVIGSK